MKLRNRKTGKIIELDYITVNEHIITLYTVNPETEEYCYSKLQAVFEDWEDYKPDEPLIKDEKIRKIVRDWAECCGFSLLKHYFSEGLSCFICTDEEDNDSCCLDFTSRIDNLEYGKLYTIKELCGEDKE